MVFLTKFMEPIAEAETPSIRANGFQANPERGVGTPRRRHYL